MNQPFLKTELLKKIYSTKKGKIHAVDNINISIEKGTTLGVVGESGCGKSTLGRLLLRLIDPTGGKIFFNGQNILSYDKKAIKKMRKEIQMIFQDPYSSINPRMTVSEIIGEPIIINRIYHNRKDVEKRVIELMETVGLAKQLYNHYPHELDGGRRQRIGIAKALSVNPSFVVCDEPVSSLDVSIQAQILNLLMDLQETQRLTYFFITHNLSVVKHISKDIMVMYAGQCVEFAPRNDIFANPLHPYTKALLESIPTLDINKKNIFNHILEGEVKVPINPMQGCRFANRCALLNEKCIGRDLPLIEIEPKHFVMCTLFEK